MDTIQISVEKEKLKFINTRYIEKESGAQVRIKYTNKIQVTGDEKQRTRALSLINGSLDKALYLPTIGFKLLELDSRVDINNIKFQFIKHKEKLKDNDQYFVQLMKKTDEKKSSEIDDLVFLFDQKLEISLPPSTDGYTTSENLDYCLKKIYSQLSNADPTDLERKEIRLNLFFGRELFSRIEKPEKAFGIKEWCGFSRKRIRSSFQQDAPQILEKMNILEKSFGFKEDKDVKDKGSIAIYFDQDSKRRKFKLHWNEKERLWKITKCVRDINRVAILDSISGSEAPDYRFLMKTCREIRIRSNLTNIINEIQSKSSFSLRDGLWFRVRDFEGKLDKVEIRQIMSKRRFFNERFQISVVCIKQDSNNKLSVQQTTSLKNRSWRSVENIDQNLGLHYNEREISNTIYETVQFAREIVKVLS